MIRYSLSIEDAVFAMKPEINKNKYCRITRMSAENKIGAIDIGASCSGDIESAAVQDWTLRLFYEARENLRPKGKRTKTAGVSDTLAGEEPDLKRSTCCCKQSIFTTSGFCVLTAISSGIGINDTMTVP